MPERSSTEGETKRLQALHSLKMLDTKSDSRFERVTRLAKRLFNVPAAVFMLADSHDAALPPVLVAALAGTGADEIVIIPDLHADARFADHLGAASGRPVLGDVEIRFIAAYHVAAPDGSRIGTLCLVDNVPRALSADDTDLLNELGAMIDEELRSWSMATSDELTKLANRRGFECIASHILPIARRLRLALALVQIDLDGFKAVNDSQGHDAGDRMLVTFAKHLLKNFRQSDVVARLGGDEFCVLMSGTDEAQVRHSLHRLRRRIEAAGGGAIGFSAGIATFDPHRHAALGDLLRDADQRMYEVKRRKRLQPAPEPRPTLAAPSIRTA